VPLRDLRVTLPCDSMLLISKSAPAPAVAPAPALALAPATALALSHTLPLSAVHIHEFSQRCVVGWDGV
jgi:hypothetical protein